MNQPDSWDQGGGGNTVQRLSTASERPRTWWCLLRGNDTTLILQGQSAIQSLQHHHARSGIAVALLIW